MTSKCARILFITTFKGDETSENDGYLFIFRFEDLA